MGDWENSYKSLDSSFEADTVRSLGRIVTNGHLQKGEKPVHFCYDCKSALAEAEVEYEDKVSKSIDVGFKVKKDSLVKLSAAFSKEIDSCSFVIWTTTPWTIPANKALAYNESLDYILIEINDDGDFKDKKIIIADALLGSVVQECKIKDFKKLKKV